MEVIDLLLVAGVKSPDISVFGEEFLGEVEGTKIRNPAVETLPLRKLPAGEVESRMRTNVVRNRRIEESMAKSVQRVTSAKSQRMG